MDNENNGNFNTITSNEGFYTPNSPKMTDEREKGRGAGAREKKTTSNSLLPFSYC